MKVCSGVCMWVLVQVSIFVDFVPMFYTHVYYVSDAIFVQVYDNTHN